MSNFCKKSVVLNTNPNPVQTSSVVTSGIASDDNNMKNVIPNSEDAEINSCYNHWFA